MPLYYNSFFMQSFQIHLYDWVRILFGNVPFEFFIELIFRILFIYLLVLFCIRLMGKRMASQLSRNELVAISSLAASIGIPIQTPDRGLLPAAAVALVVVAAQRIVAWKLTRDGRFETKSQGNLSILVEDGVLKPRAMGRSKISRTEIFARLRSERVRHLGEVRRLYFEAEGDFTLVKNPEPGYGLCVLPEEDVDFISEQVFDNGKYVCRNCGSVKATQDQQCSNCGSREGVPPLRQ